MRTRNVRAGIAALLYSTVHYVALSKEITKWLGIESIPRIIVIAFDICLYASLAILTTMALYFGLKMTEALSRFALKTIDQFTLLIDYGIEYCRRRILLFAEALIERLKGRDAFEEPNGRQQ